MFIFTFTLYDPCRNENGGVRAARAEEEKRTESLLAEISAGSREALSGLYELMGGQVYGYALSIVKNHHEAQDIQQDVFVKIWSCAGQYRPGTKARAWIYTITKNLSLTSLRKSSRVSGQMPPEQACPEEPQRNGVLKMLLEELPPKERQIVMLHAMGAKHRETAQVMDLPLATVLSKYARTLKKLRKRLEEEE